MSASSSSNNTNHTDIQSLDLSNLSEESIRKLLSNTSQEIKRREKLKKMYPFTQRLTDILTFEMENHNKELIRLFKKIIALGKDINDLNETDWQDLTHDEKEFISTLRKYQQDIDSIQDPSKNKDGELKHIFTNDFCGFGNVLIRRSTENAEIWAL